MNLKWSKTELGETIDTLKGCAFKSKDYVFDGVPVVRVSDFTENSIAEDKLVYLSEALAEEYSAYKLQHNNIVIQTVGSWQYNPASVVGKVIKIPKKLASSLLNQNAVKLIPNQNIDEKFLYYRLKDDTFKAHVLGSAQGAANQASITLTTIKRFKFFLPPLEVQQKIAAILSAYDDLIENNLERIKLLEEMAQITYEEWFVRLKFPGHEATPMDSETGLPVEWRMGTLADLVGFLSGYAYKTEQFNSTGYPVIKIKNISDNSVDIDGCDCIDDNSANETIRFKLTEGDLLIAMTGATVGKVGILPFSHSSCFLNQRVGKFIPNESVNNIGFVYCTLSNDIGYQQILNFAGGAAQPNISGSQILSIKTVVPPFKILSKFSELISSTIQYSLNLRHQNQLLKEARDILLPRLMTGMIDVEQLVLPEPFSNAPSSPAQELQAA